MSAFAQNSPTMHPRIAELGRELADLCSNRDAAPTCVDRHRVTVLRENIRRLAEAATSLSLSDEADRGYLYVTATRLANDQEDYYEKHDGEWAIATKEQIVTLGEHARLDEVLRTFNDGALGSFANKELPTIKRALRVVTIGGLAKCTREDICGPHAEHAGNRTLEWIEMVCAAFKIEPPK